MALLDQATDAAAGLAMSSSLYLGFPGIAWAAAHLEGRLFTAADGAQEDVDATLLRSLRSGTWKGTYDLFHGLVGLGIYALERLPRPAARQTLQAVVTQLAGLAERTPEGATFFSPVATLARKFAPHLPDGAYALGMSQGVAGVVALLGSACHARVARRAARPLLARTVSWLLARERPAGSDYRFPIFHFPGIEPFGFRLAWCIGDLGIAAALLLAARGADDPAWEAEARRIALAAAARSTDRRPVVDAGLRQGTAGIAHAFNRLYQATGEEELGSAARLWFRRTLALREPGTGVGGFRLPPGGDTDEWTDEPGFLDGATGTGLALLAAASPLDPAWDHALLLSAPTSHVDA